MAAAGDEKTALVHRCCNCDWAGGSSLTPLTNFTGMYVCVHCMFSGVPIRPDVIQAIRPNQLEVAQAILRFTDARQKLERELEHYV